mgnify:FL=1
MESLSLYELGRLIRLALNQGLPDAYWVQAELSEVREAYNGHCYIELVQKAERKGRTKAEVDEVICWLTGYDADGLQAQLDKGVDMTTFYAEAPCMHPNRDLIKGVVCGIRVENVEDPLMKTIRQLDKLVDELAKGKAMEKILRR